MPAASRVRFRVRVFPTLTVDFVDDLAQALLVRQREFEKLNQAAQFRRNGDRRRGDDDGAPVGGKFLSHIAQPADYDRIVHVAMKVFEHKCRFERHRLQVAERLGGFLAVVEGLGAGIWIVSGAAGREDGSIPGPVRPRRCRNGPVRWQCSTRKWPDSARSRPPAPGAPPASLPRFPSPQWAWKS